MLMDVVTDGVDRPEDVGMPIDGARTADASAASDTRAAVGDSGGGSSSETRFESRRAARARAAAAQTAPPAPQPVSSEAEPHVAPAPSTDVIQTVQRRQWTRGLLALAVALIVLVALGFGAARLGELLFDPPSAAVVALEQIEAAPDAQSASAVVTGGGEATLHWSEILGAAVLVADDLAPLESGQTYELWVVRGESYVSAGTFEPDAEGSATAQLTGDIAPDDVVAVSVEPSGGSPTGEPSTDPIVTIPTS